MIRNSFSARRSPCPRPRWRRRRASPTRRWSSANRSRCRGRRNSSADMRQGALLYFNQVNARGGVNGRKVVLRRSTTATKPRAPPRTRRSSSTTRRCSRSSATWVRPPRRRRCRSSPRAKVPFVGPFTGAELLRTPVNPLIFNVRASYYDETEAIVQHLTAMSVTDRRLLPERRVRHGRAHRCGPRLKKRGWRSSPRAPSNAIRWK